MDSDSIVSTVASSGSSFLEEALGTRDVIDELTTAHIFEMLCSKVCLVVRD